jgi:hypothetical protein
LIEGVGHVGVLGSDAGAAPLDVSLIVNFITGVASRVEGDSGGNSSVHWAHGADV